jgi:hypothetical protein
MAKGIVFQANQYGQFGLVITIFLIVTYCHFGSVLNPSFWVMAEGLFTYGFTVVY